MVKPAPKWNFPARLSSESSERPTPHGPWVPVGAKAFSCSLDAASTPGTVVNKLNERLMHLAHARRIHPGMRYRLSAEEQSLQADVRLLKREQGAEWRHDSYNAYPVFENPVKAKVAVPTVTLYTNGSWYPTDASEQPPHAAQVGPTAQPAGLPRSRRKQPARRVLVLAQDDKGAKRPRHPRQQLQHWQQPLPYDDEDVEECEGGSGNEHENAPVPPSGYKAAKHHPKRR